MASGPATEKQKEVHALMETTHALMKELREGLRIAADINGRLATLEDRLKGSVVEEIEAVGGGTVGRRRRSTNLETSSDEAREVSKKAAEPPPLEKGKRACGKCRRTGHRRTTCPN